MDPRYGLQVKQKENPWLRLGEFTSSFDIDTKRACLKVSASVVSLECVTKDKRIYMASGTIIDSTDNLNGTCVHTILTCASVLGPYPGNDTKLEVKLFDGRVFEGIVLAFDPHYNLAFINIVSNSPLSIAALRHVDDSISIDPTEICSPADKFMIRRHSDAFKLTPGDVVIGIGRHHKHEYVMIHPGYFSLDCCDLDCKDLMRANCRMHDICGIGGPLVNRYGEVIGINLYNASYTPFLPVNIVSKCWDHFKKQGKFCRPWLGLETTNLCIASTTKLEYIFQNFPNIFTGVIIEKVVPESPAERAGLRYGDIIVQCDKTCVPGYLGFFEKIWDKVGQSMEVDVIRGVGDSMEGTVIREGSADYLNLTMLVDEISPNNFNRWPPHEELPVRGQRARPSSENEEKLDLSKKYKNDV